MRNADIDRQWSVASRQLEPDPEDERTLWIAEVASVTPLRKDHRVRVRTMPPVSTPGPTEAYRTPPVRTRNTEPDETDGDAGYVSAGVDRRELRRLRRGQYAPGRRLDLHGLTRKSAVAQVDQFLESTRGVYRCVAIVHGRGLHSAGKPLIKTDVRALLRSHAGVLAYSDAPRDDGGSGAVYVLLRMTRR